MVTAMAMNERSEAGGITSGWLPLFVAVSILINPWYRARRQQFSQYPRLSSPTRRRFALI